MALKCQSYGCDRYADKRGYCEMHYMRLYRSGQISKRTNADRFWALVDKSGECWEWTGGLRGGGYGLFKLQSPEGKRVSIGAHRFAYAEQFGPIPDGMQIDHKCHNRRCVNPKHLRLATHKQNVENLAGLRADNTSGYRGVEFRPNLKRWRACAQHNKKFYSAGWYESPEEAAEAAKQLRLSLFTHNDLDRRTA